jgi:lipoprotein-anchoring transpeptidase ErfK/SrfK
MAKGRHSTRTTPRRGWLVVLIGVLSLALLGGGTAFATYRYDLESSSRILPGVRIGDVDVGGMSREEAVAAVAERADLTLTRTLVVRTQGASWTLSPEALGTRAGVDQAVEAAFALADGESLLSRVYHRVADEPLRADLDLGFAYDDDEIASFVERASAEVAEPAVNADLRLVDDELVVRRAKQGQEIRVRAAIERVRQALEQGSAGVRIPMRTIEPKVTAASLGRTIVVDVSENVLYLYDGFSVERQYRVATAAEGFSTPFGAWTVVNKVENPSWTNPDPDGWGADMPAYIPPGPSNPLGTRALYLNAPGIRIHGTTNVDSIGTYASHGCIRMLMSEVEELYPLIPIGTEVLVKP